jgi:N-acylneuraminate cytidylyltransferase
MIDVREKKYASNLIPMKQVYKYLAKKVKTKFVCYLHVTSPFLKDITLKKSINLFTKNLKKFNSLATVTTLKEYMWQNGKPLNYNPEKTPNSQDLPDIYALNYACSIISRKDQINYSNLCGKNPLSRVCGAVRSMSARPIACSITCTFSIQFLS